MNNDLFNYIIERIISNADDAREEEKTKNADFYKGKSFAYYEVLDTIKNDLITEEYDLSECGLDIDLEEKYLGLKRV